MDINASIQWYEDRKGKVTYSMNARRGPSSYDCSSALYLALIQGGYLPSTIYIGNTDTLFNDLENHGWVQLQPNSQGNFDTQRGDVFIWGVRGSSTGADGHTGVFVDSDNIDHCSYGYNGIAESNYDWLHAINGNKPQTFYRYTANESAPNNPTDQVVEVGSYIKFTQPYNVDDVQIIGDVWQVKTNALCPIGFTWADNGIPAVAVTEVTDEGFATPDQVLDIGSKYVIPGKFLVEDVGQSSGRWLAEISFNGLSFWIDLETVTEVSANDPGSTTPMLKPVAAPPVSAPSQSSQPAATKPVQENIPTPPEAPTRVDETRTLSQWLKDNPIASRALHTFWQAFVAAFAVGWPSIQAVLPSQKLSANVAALVALLVACVSAGLSAVKTIIVQSK